MRYEYEARIKIANGYALLGIYQKSYFPRTFAELVDEATIGE